MKRKVYLLCYRGHSANERYLREGSGNEDDIEVGSLAGGPMDATTAFKRLPAGRERRWYRIPPLRCSSRRCSYRGGLGCTTSSQSFCSWSDVPEPAIIRPAPEQINRRSQRPATWNQLTLLVCCASASRAPSGWCAPCAPPAGAPSRGSCRESTPSAGRNCPPSPLLG